MTKPSADKEALREALDGLIGLSFDVIRGNVSHGSRLISQSFETEAEVDAFQELAQFWARAFRDAGRTFSAGQEFFQRLGSPKTATEAGPVPSSGPASAATATPKPCGEYELPVDPDRTPGAVQPMPLRHRGDQAPSITPDRITVTPSNVAKGVTKLKVEVECMGEARGLYVGDLMIGSVLIPYNIYIDPN